ncbi:MAG: hypothetical protein SF069_08495 [Phycisphaerae bacterium]|nr:hypothetical protein [Phycisphaerae bacterium]
MAERRNPNELTEAELANRDPITGAPGAHPVSVGVGAAAGGVTGAAVGAIGGPAGAVVGAGVGAVLGGLAGKAAAEEIDPSIESAYWRDNYAERPYVTYGAPYDTYEAAYRLGWESAQNYRGQTFEQVEPQLEREWTRLHGQSKTPWAVAKQAARDAWERVTRRAAQPPAE